MAVNNNLWFWSWVMVWGNPLNNQSKGSSVYNTAPNKVEKFPWLNSQQIANIEKYTENLTWMEKTMEQQKLYQAMIEQIQTDNYKENRTAAENGLIYKMAWLPSIQQINNVASNVRQEVLADMTKEKFWLRADADTQWVISWLMKYAQDQWVSLDSLNNYLDKWDPTFLYEVWLKTQPIKEDTRSIKSTIANQEEEKEWNDNFFWRLETEEYNEDAGFLGNAWTFTKNVAKSGVNVLSDVWNIVLNPLDTANSLAKTAVWGVANLVWVDEDMAEWGDRWSSANDTADQVWQFFTERYGWGDEILNTLFTDPVGVVSDVASLISWWAWVVKWVTKWAAKWAAKAWLKWAASTLEDVSKTAGKVSKTAMNLDPYTQAMKLDMKAVSKTIDAAKKIPWAAKMMKWKLDEALNKAIWLDENTKKNIQNNPFSKEVWQKAKTWIDANWLPEKSSEVSNHLISEVSEKVQEVVKNELNKLEWTWPMYKPLKEAWYSVDLSELKAWINEMLNEYWIKIEDWKLDFSKTAIDGSEASNIQKVYNWIQSTDAPMSMTEYLERFRKTLSDMVDFNTNNKNAIWKKLADTPWDKVIKGIREKANALAHEQVPALKDLDAAFAKEADLVKEITEWIVYKDKAKQGVVRDNIDQIIKNLDTSNRKQLKDRLEKIIPWLREEVRAINMLPKLIDKYYKPSKIQQAITSWVWWAIWWSIGNLPWWLIGAWVWYRLWNKLDKLKSKRWDKIISTTSEEWQSKLADIQNRIANNEKISQTQAEFLKGISEKLKAQWEVKDAEITRIISEVASAEEWMELAVLDKAIKELETIWAKEELKEIRDLKEWMTKKITEEAEMNKANEEFINEMEKASQEWADQRLPEFKKRIYQLEQQEKRVWRVAWKKIWKTFEWKDYKKSQDTAWLKAKEKLIEEIAEYYNVDQFEAQEIYDRIYKTVWPDDLK